MYNVFAGDEMNVDITKLRNNIEEYINIDYLYSFDKIYLENTDLISLNSVSIKGYITKDTIDNIMLDIDISGTMVLPCAVTLNPVNYPFNFKVEGILEEILSEIDEKNKKIENTIDILPIIWENILMEIPMKVVSEDARKSNLKGNGWRLITEEEENQNPELAKLKDLL